MRKINLARRICAMLLALLLIAGAACADSKGLLGWFGKKAKPGDKVYIEASDRTDEGLTFVYWRSNLADLVIGDIYSPKTYYIMPEGDPDIKIQAVYTQMSDVSATATPVPKPIIITTPTPRPTAVPTKLPILATPTPNATAAPQPDYSDLYYVAFCEKDVSLRKGPSKDTAKLLNVPIGACVEAISYGHGDFLHVSYEGREGYILWEYLLAYDDMPALPGERVYIVNCENNVTLRDTPFMHGRELAFIPLGGEVEFLGIAANEYAYVRYKNQTGFVLEYFVDI